MRSALSLKPTNANSTGAAANNAKATTIKNAPLGGGKLKRQTGTSNLHREVITVKPAKEEQLIKINSKEASFEVYEDPDPVVEKVPEEKVNDENKEQKKEPTEEPEYDSNNLIHELERKMEAKRQAEEQKKKKFTLTRDNNDTMSRCSEPPSEALSSVYDDDDFDKHSVASSTFTTTVRASFSTFHENNETTDFEENKRTVIRKKAEKEARDEAMFCVDEYFDDFLKYMMHRQMKNRPEPNYFSEQDQIKKEDRTILVDWFNSVVKQYGLQKETFHLAVKLVDRFLSVLNFDKAQFQLVGTTALMIAAKYEEIFVPEIVEFALITDNAYRVEDILSMESFILLKFDFVIALPTTAWFGACFAKRMKFTTKMNKAMNYILDLSLMDAVFLRFRPSDIAAAAICFVNVQYGLEAWPQKMVDETDIKSSDFVDALKHLHRVYISASFAPPQNKSIFNQYSEKEEKKVALTPAPTDKLKKLFPSLFESAPKKTSAK